MGIKSGGHKRASLYFTTEDKGPASLVTTCLTNALWSMKAELTENNERVCPFHMIEGVTDSFPTFVKKAIADGVYSNYPSEILGPHCLVQTAEKAETFHKVGHYGKSKITSRHVLEYNPDTSKAVVLHVTDMKAVEEEIMVFQHKPGLLENC